MNFQINSYKAIFETNILKGYNSNSVKLS